MTAATRNGADEMTATGAFRKAVEAKDVAAVTASLAPDVTFHSPVMPKPYRGRDQVAVLLQVLLEVFEDFRYTYELAGEGAHALIFEARVGDRQLQGMDLIRSDDEGRIAEFTVMVRPASGLMALGERIGPALQAAGV